jgi:hypothetical protein
MKVGALEYIRSPGFTALRERLWFVFIWHGTTQNVLLSFVVRSTHILRALTKTATFMELHHNTCV